MQKAPDNRARGSHEKNEKAFWTVKSLIILSKNMLIFNKKELINHFHQGIPIPEGLKFQGCK
jgi:hypothetical protein